MGYVEAVKDLAARAGMQVPEFGSRPRGPAASAAKHVEQYEANSPDLLQRAAQFYKAELKRPSGRSLTSRVAG